MDVPKEEQEEGEKTNKFFTAGGTPDSAKKASAKTPAPLAEALTLGLRQTILDYEDANPWINGKGKPSIQQVADKALSSYTTINNIRRGVPRKMSLFKTLEISGRLGGPDNLKGLLDLAKKSDLKMEGNISKCYHMVGHEKNTVRTEKFYGYLKKPRYMRIIWAAAGKGGNTSRQEIAYNLGRDGLNALEELLEEGVLEEKDGIVTIPSLAKDESVLLESDVLGDQLEHLVGICNPSRKGHWIHFQTKKVSKDFANLSHRRMGKFISELIADADRPENRGEKQMVYLALACNFFEEPGNNDNPTKGVLQ